MPFSPKKPRSIFAIASTFVIASVRLARSCWMRKRPMAVAESTPTMATVMINSIRVKPRRFRLRSMGAPPGGNREGRGRGPGPPGFRATFGLELALTVERLALADRVQQVLSGRRDVVDAR